MIGPSEVKYITVKIPVRFYRHKITKSYAVESLPIGKITLESSTVDEGLREIKKRMKKAGEQE